jgi:hypothetical protein
MDVGEKIFCCTLFNEERHYTLGQTTHSHSTMDNKFSYYSKKCRKIVPNAELNFIKKEKL